MQPRRWEHFEHDADIGLRATAPSREGLFEAMAEALTGLVTDPEKVRPSEAVSIECEAPDDALLLTDWLNALIYEMATRKMLFSRFEVTIEDGKLHATLSGEPVDVARHAPAVEPKGATFTGLVVGPGPDGRWRAECIVDV